MLDIAELAPGLERRSDGIWFASRPSQISYPDHGNAACLQVEDRSFWFRHRNRCITSVVSRFAPQCGGFLDIGGGNGYVAKGLEQAGIPCALIEPGIDGAAAARRRGIDPVICASLDNAGILPGSFEAAGMFDVLEHIEDEVGALWRARALLRPGGRLFLTVPAYAFLRSADDVVAGHFRRYTLVALANALRRAEYRVEYGTYMFTLFPPLIFLLRTVPSRLGLRDGVDEQRQAAELAPDGLAVKLINRALYIEARRIQAGGSVPFGTSCLAVAVAD